MATRRTTAELKAAYRKIQEDSKLSRDAFAEKVHALAKAEGKLDLTPSLCVRLAERVAALSANGSPCDACKGTGKFHARSGVPTDKKCFRCSGKGTISAVDAERNARYDTRVATGTTGRAPPAQLADALRQAAPVSNDAMSAAKLAEEVSDDIAY